MSKTLSSVFGSIDQILSDKTFLKMSRTLGLDQLSSVFQNESVKSAAQFIKFLDSCAKFSRTTTLWVNKVISTVI